jgi:hypothetical protein
VVLAPAEIVSMSETDDLGSTLKKGVREYVPSDSDLTLAAREAIRSFVWRQIVPSAVVLAIISALAGWIVKDYMVTEAKSHAAELAQKEIDDARSKLKTAEDELFDAKAKFNQQTEGLKFVVNDLDSKTKLATKMIGLLDDLKDYSPDQITQLKDILHRFSAAQPINTPDPHIKPAAPSGSEDKADQVTSIAKALRSLALNTDDKAGVGEGTTSRCPAGSYAVGFDMQASSGGAHGILYGGRIVCRNFPAIEEK